MYLRKIVLFAVFFGFICISFAQNPWDALSKRPSLIDSTQGKSSFSFLLYNISIWNASQTIAGINPTKDASFDFTPSQRFYQRTSKGMNQLGDINIQWKLASADKWRTYRSAEQRLGIKTLSDAQALMRAELNLPEELAPYLQITRTWKRVKANQGEDLVMEYQLKNIGSSELEIGALGFPMIFNNILQGQTLEAAHHQNSFYDSYMGMNGGYLQVTKLDGKGSVLLIVPENNTPFENYRPLMEDPTPRGLDFEGFYEWTVLSKSYASNEWKDAKQWNDAHGLTLKPGEEKSYGLRFLLAPSIKEIESTLIANKRPVAVGYPGYVLPTDVDGSLFLHADAVVKSITVSPQNALSVKSEGIKNGWKKYSLKGLQYGRARITVTYANGEEQTIHYKVILPEQKTIENYGHFLNTKHWFEQDDPYFHRSPGYITYDNEKKQQVTQDSRAWIAGLSDEGGAGSWLGAAMKQMVLPNKEEISKLERFVDTTMRGQIQYNSGEHKYGVRKSLFFYAPDSFPKGTYDTSINFKTWSAWPVKEALDPGRSYNYPHVTAAYWSLYRLARNHQNLVEKHPWNWYLQQAYKTAMNMVTQAPYYAQFGQMEGAVFCFLLKDLKSEGLTKEANALEAEMKKRALHWDELPFPFESEMPWDSTGQEEVYVWSMFFGYLDKADVTYNAILAYDPSIPHWAYNGNARRYWDFLYGGKLQRIERMIHHYGSELNAIPLLEHYKQNPKDLYTLRVGYGGVLGGISNIEEDGFAPAAFHSFPSTLKNDGISGDYGSGFFGYAVNTESFLTKDETFGWLGFGGNAKEKKNSVVYYPTTASRNRFFIAPANLDVHFLAGQVDHFVYSEKDKSVSIWLKQADTYTKEAVLAISGDYVLSEVDSMRQDGKVVVSLNVNQLTKIVLKVK